MQFTMGKVLMAYGPYESVGNSQLTTRVVLLKSVHNWIYLIF